MKAIKKLIDVIATWLFSQKSKHTRSCRDIAEDEKKKKSKKDGFAY